MHISEILDIAKLQTNVNEGYIKAAKNTALPLTLYSYTEKTQFNNYWTPETLQCRGLIVEDTGQIIARCLSKFFNYSQYTNGSYEVEGKFSFKLPNESFQIYEKLDGSLGTVFWYEDDWHVASRGSFHSEQAVWATEYLRSGDSYRDILNKSLTYVVEIIYPSNRIVVDYGERQDLVLLTVFNNETGEECLTEDLKLEWGWVGSIAKQFEPYSLTVSDLTELAAENVQIGNDEDKTAEGYESEGYVVKYRSGHRVKVKLADYLRLHKVLTNCTERSIWEALSADQSLDVFIENVPDEFHSWVLKTKDSLLKQVDNYVHTVTTEYQTLMDGLNWTEDRKVFALVAKQSKYSGSLFSMRDGNLGKVVKAAWAACRPDAAKPFVQGDN